jgi:hypothetical protein
MSEEAVERFHQLYDRDVRTIVDELMIGSAASAQLHVSVKA